MGAKFLLTVGVLVPAVVTTAGIGAVGLQQMSERTDALYTHGLGVSEHTADVLSAALTLHETALFQVAVQDERLNAQISSELDLVLVPDLRTAIEVLHGDYAEEAAQERVVGELETGLATYLQFRLTGAYDDGPVPVGDADRSALARRTDLLMEPIVAAAQQLRTQGAEESAGVKARADDAYRSTRVLLALTVLVVLLLGLGVVRALIRNMVPRITQYSRFASDVAAGRDPAPLQPSGTDELTELGVALNDIVVQRNLAAAADLAQQDLLRRADRAQAEFVDTLQVTRDEDEAQELLQHHLQRSLPGSTVAVLRQNNSANRLEAATTLPPGSTLAARLVGAEPRSCVAVRLGRPHSEGPGQEGLLPCTLCARSTGPTTCEPLLVGGEVIGAVLVDYPEELAATAELAIRTTVGQAAPVLANLRSLALAEFRANNDSLTGLPNKRATEDTLKRMVAQASRSVTALTAIMLDLDHFKQINDRFGHSQGDDVLAAVGAAISSSLRASDFAGRVGGEEFLVLLPDTGLDGAFLVAEKIRRSVAAITVPGVDRDITASLGVAGLLEHAGNANGLLREADKAQYAAKAGGRNRTVVATPEATPADAAPPAEDRLGAEGAVAP